MIPDPFALIRLVEKFILTSRKMDVTISSCRIRVLANRIHVRVYDKHATQRIAGLYSLTADGTRVLGFVPDSQILPSELGADHKGVLGAGHVPAPTLNLLPDNSRTFTDVFPNLYYCLLILDISLLLLVCAG